MTKKQLLELLKLWEQDAHREWKKRTENDFWKGWESGRYCAYTQVINYLEGK